MAEIQRADLQARRRALWATAVGTVVGGTLIYLFRRYEPIILEWIRDDPVPGGPRLRVACAVVTVALSVPTLAFAVYCWRVGGRVVDRARFPPPGTSVFRDTPVITGVAARRRGRFLQAAAAALAVAAVAIAVLFYRLVSPFGSW